MFEKKSISEIKDWSHIDYVCIKAKSGDLFEDIYYLDGHKFFESSLTEADINFINFTRGINSYGISEKMVGESSTLDRFYVRVNISNKQQELRLIDYLCQGYRLTLKQKELLDHLRNMDSIIKSFDDYHPLYYCGFSKMCKSLNYNNIRFYFKTFTTDESKRYDTGVVFIQESILVEKKMYNPYSSYIIPKSKKYELVEVESEVYLPKFIAKNMITEGYLVNFKQQNDREEILDYVYKENLKKLEKFHKKFEKNAHVEEAKKPKINRIIFLLCIGILNLWSIIILIPALFEYLYYKNTYNYEINVWIWGPILILLSIIIEIIMSVRFKNELSKYRRKKKQQNLIKQEALIKYSIEELEKDIKSKNYKNLSNTTYKFIHYSQHDISVYMEDLVGKGIQTTFYQLDDTPIKPDILLMALIFIILIAARSWNKVQTDKIELFNTTTIVSDNNLPDDMYKEVNFIIKKDSLSLAKEWNNSFKKLMSIQEECLLQDDYERLNSYLPVYELFNQGGNNLASFVDDDYYAIIESNDDIKTKLIAYSLYDYQKQEINESYDKKIKFYVYYDAEIYHTKIDYGSRNEINDYNISSVSKNKKIDNKIYKDMEKFTEYEITKDDWTFQNVYDMLRQD